MASSSAGEPSSETRNWVEMADEIMGGMGALEILKSAQKVCTTWRRICKDPAMWKVIRINHSFQACDEDYVIEKLSKQAIHRSCGELIDIGLKRFGTDDLLDYISRSSNKLNHLRLSSCSNITLCGLINALKRLPHLETLELSYINLCAEHIEDIGRNEVKAILNGFPHLESLDLRGCFFLHLDKNLEKLCKERIKDFKFQQDNIPEGYEESDMEMIDYDDDINISQFYDGGELPEDDGMYGYGFPGGSPIFEEDAYDYFW